MAASSAIAAALASLGEMLAADGYKLVLREDGMDQLIAEIRAGPDACADCLVPKPMMLTYFNSALSEGLDVPPPEVKLIYPADFDDK
jgi:hypothetical protein